MIDQSLSKEDQWWRDGYGFLVSDRNHNKRRTGARAGGWLKSVQCPLPYFCTHAVLWNPDCLFRENTNTLWQNTPFIVIVSMVCSSTPVFSKLLVKGSSPLKLTLLLFSLHYLRWIFCRLWTKSFKINNNLTVSYICCNDTTNISSESQLWLYCILWVWVTDWFF